MASFNCLLYVVTIRTSKHTSTKRNAVNISINNQAMTAEQFKSEAELQALIEQNPHLLIGQSEPAIVYTHRELNLPDAGFLDLFCIDEEGTPIAVEVKLGRNAESRRKVVAQAFDYAADLSELTIDELDDICDGSIEECLSGLDIEENLWKRCGTNLRAGQMKIVIAVDESNESLNRMVRYINEHSDLDVRLVAISKFSDGNILVPNIIVSGGGQEKVVKKAKASAADESGVYRENFEKVVEHWNANFSARKTTGGSAYYRQIKVEKWPSKIHYEFCNLHKSDEIGVELHNETGKYPMVADYIEELNGKSIKGHEIKVSRKSGSPRGRAMIRLPSSTSPEIFESLMKELIATTIHSVGNIIMATKNDNN